MFLFFTTLGGTATESSAREIICITAATGGGRGGGGELLPRSGVEASRTGTTRVGARRRSGDGGVGSQREKKSRKEGAKEKGSAFD